MRKVYMDHAATTPVREEVLQAMLPYFTDTFGNASSIHSFGQEARKAVEGARDTVADCLGADPTEICFTSGGTEGNNMAVKGAARAYEKRGDHIVTSQIEHHSVLNCFGALEDGGVSASYLPVDGDGLVDPESLRETVTPDTTLVSVTLANSETGTVEPIAELAAVARESKIAFHTDAVQAVGKIPVDVNELNVDLLTVSAHKVYGPKGIGALYIRKGTRIAPLLHGGHHERNRRAGTENVPAIVGFAKAIELACSEASAESTRLAALRDRLEAGIKERIDLVRTNGSVTSRLPSVLNMSFEFVEGEALLIGLDMKGIAVSTGSACTSGSVEPSHVLRAMGIPPTTAHASLRFSLGRGNTQKDVDYVLDVLPQVVGRLRQLSPDYSRRCCTVPGGANVCCEE
jgi:cysteine desulfurase